MRFQETNFVPNALLSEPEIYQLGNPKTYQGDKLLLGHYLAQIRKITLGTFDEAVERYNTIHNIPMDDDTVDETADELKQNIENFALSLKHFDDKLKLYNLIADRRALIWYPPKGVAGDVLVQHFVNIEDMKPFNYLLHTFREMETPKLMPSRTKNGLLLDKNCPLPPTNTRVDIVANYSAGEITDLDRESYIATRNNLLKLSRRIAPYMGYYGIDLTELTKMLNQPHYTISPKQQNNAREPF